MCKIHEKIATSKRYEHKDVLTPCGGNRIDVSRTGTTHSFKSYLRRRWGSTPKECRVHYIKPFGW